MSFKPMWHGAHGSKTSPPFTSSTPLISLHYPDITSLQLFPSLTSFWLPLVLYTELFGSSRSTTLYSSSKTVATYISSSYAAICSLFESVMQLRIILYRRTPEFALRPLHAPLRTPGGSFSIIFNITTIMRSSIHHSIHDSQHKRHATKPQKYQ